MRLKDVGDYGATPRNSFVNKWKIIETRVAAIIILLLVSLASADAAQSVTLAWDPSPDPSVAGYTVYYGCASGEYTNGFSVGNSATVTIPNLREGATYFFVVTAWDGSGQESLPSNEVSYTVPGVALNVREAHLPGFPDCVLVTSVGTPPSAWALEQSSDLQHWTRVAAGTNVAVAVSFEIGNAPQMFFRLKGN